MSKFKKGDKVQIKPEVIGDFLQPWRGRFERGIEGEVKGHPIGASGYDATRINVHWKGKKGAWNFTVRASDLEKIA